MRRKGRVSVVGGLDAFSGVVDLILASLIIAGWPGSAVWALGVVVGVNLISSGIAIFMVATTYPCFHA